MRLRRGEVLALFGAGVFLAAFPCLNAQGPADEPEKLTREQVIAQTMKPFQGTSEKGVDRSTLKGKVLCGYQGWHAAEGDGCGRGWYHWAGRNGFKPGSTNVDLWPDVRSLVRMSVTRPRS